MLEKACDINCLRDVGVGLSLACDKHIKDWRSWKNVLHSTALVWKKSCQAMSIGCRNFLIAHQKVDLFFCLHDFLVLVKGIPVTCACNNNCAQWYFSELSSAFSQLKFRRKKREEISHATLPKVFFVRNFALDMRYLDATKRQLRISENECKLLSLDSAFFALHLTLYAPWNLHRFLFFSIVHQKRGTSMQ